jgi:23S rRNA (uracil1939-C5)-methyltransferase
MDGAPVLTRRPPLLRMGGVAVTPPPAGFLQATADAEARLAADVCEALAGARRVADLFSGCGAFTFALAGRAAVSAVEIDAAALGALDAAARKAERLKPIATEARDLFRDPLDARALGRFDGVVFDPPRAGAAAQAAEIARSGVAQVAAVSCNPESFARDARTLVDGGYRMLWARPVDQFRWSAHVEVTAAFARG